MTSSDPTQEENRMSTNAIDPNETTATRRRRGEDIVATLSAGAPRPASLDALERDFPFLANAVNAYAVGEVFGRDVLDVRTRQLALVAAFAVLGLGDFIKIHGGYALNAGATEEELKEIVYLTTIPGGFPRAIQASQAVAELIASRRTN
jgi:4-carboxymuconolactone decarboxylase